jgi:hypothetical protein
MFRSELKRNLKLKKDVSKETAAALRNAPGQQIPVM